MTTLERLIMSGEKPTEEFCHFDSYYEPGSALDDTDHDVWEYYDTEHIKKRSWFPFYSYKVGYRRIYRKRTKDQQLEYLREMEEDYLNSIKAIQAQAEENLVRAKDVVQSLQQKITELSKTNSEK